MLIGHTCYFLSFFLCIFIEINSHWWGLQSESKGLKIWNFEIHFFWTLKPTKNIHNIWILTIRVDISPVSLLLTKTGNNWIKIFCENIYFWLILMEFLLNFMFSPDRKSILLEQVMIIENLIVHMMLML